jgi:hypothetical protein
MDPSEEPLPPSPSSGTGDATHLQTDSRRARYGDGSEAMAVRRELGNFDPDNSRASAAIRDSFGQLKIRELKAVVRVVQDVLARRHGISLPPLTRNTKRSHQLLVKYVDEHYDRIVPVFQMITLLNEDRLPIHARA